MPLKIQLDVAAVAAKYNVDPLLVQAVVAAEGNIVKAVQISVPRVKTREEALNVLCRSIIGAMTRFIKSDTPATPDLQTAFINHWAKRWAPQGAKNDPTNLNKNWPKNVLKLWRMK